MQESEKMFGEESKSEPQFMEQLHDTLKQIPILPQQSQFPFDLEVIEEEDMELQVAKQIPREQKPTQPKAPPPQSQHLRVEVWRESKNSKKNIRVSKF
jgi:hypothetical protein